MGCFLYGKLLIMNSPASTLFIVSLSAISVLATSFGSHKNLFVLCFGVSGICLSTYLIFALRFSNTRVVAHLVILTILSAWGYVFLKKHLTKDS